MNLRVAMTGEVKYLWYVSAVKASLNRAHLVGWGRRETE